MDGLRWRDLFLKAAVHDEGALSEIAKYPGPLGKLPLTRNHDDVRKRWPTGF